MADRRCNSVREHKAGGDGLLQSNAVRALLGIMEVGEDLEIPTGTLKIPGDMDDKNMWQAGVLAVLGIVGCGEFGIYPQKVDI